ncbi:MAG TPA: PVC-type heme-binding CxxCH protein [Planctomicrobium sp.]|nr:PVC-type heme-binding CxxCH protein [Planctomicrobium sp.]
MRLRIAPLILSGFLLSTLLFAADGKQTAPSAKPQGEEPDYSTELPRTPSRTVAESLKTFELAPGYKIQCLASEPLVASPVATCFDADGHLYIAEMRDYSEQETESLGRIRRLVDTDQDGVFDTATVYAEGLSWPTAILAYDGGVFVGAAPDIWYFKDHDGDGIAEERKVVFTGFGRSNVQGLLNSFRWGLDNRIHGATSSSGGVVTSPDHPDVAAINLRGRDFSFDPKKLDLRPESGGAQHGMSFDEWGRKFLCSNSRHALCVAFEDHYLSRNPLLPVPNSVVSIATDGDQATVYRSSPVEPWRIVRTRLRVQGIDKGAVEGGGRAAGYFTGSTGITIYKGDALPDLLGMAIVADVGSNIVHRKKLTPQGAAFRADRVDDNSEFVRSDEIWFRPVQFANSPDGCLHILDFYREVVEHPKSIPLSIKKHLDLTNGRDKGRIYRVTPENYTFRPTPHFSSMPSAELVSWLSHDNSWHRETASRLLYERQDLSVLPALKQLITSCEKPLGRLHALVVLQGLGGLSEEDVLQTLKDSHPRLREWGIRLAESFTDRERIQKQLALLTTDEDFRVRYQLAFTAGEFPVSMRVDWLTKLLQQDAADNWMRLAAMSSLNDGAVAVFANLIQNQEVRQSSEKSIVLDQLLQLVVRQNLLPDLEQALQLSTGVPENETALKNRLITTLLTGGAGAEQIRQLITRTNPNFLADLFDSARQGLNSKRSVSDRIASIQILKLSQDPQDLKELIALLTPTENQNVQSAVLMALKSSRDPTVANELLARWSTLSPGIRTQAEELLFSRNIWLEVMFAQLEKGELPRGAISAVRLQNVSRGANANLAKKANDVLNSLGTTSRAEAIQQYASALSKTGDANRGRQIFQKECSGCHRVGGVGFETGPNLVAMQNRGKEAILLNVLDPNREVNPEFLNYVISLEDGRTLTGMIRSESATSLTLLRGENQSETALRSEIDQIRNSGLSLMPEGLEKQIDQQAMADLLEFLMTVKSDQ